MKEKGKGVMEKLVNEINKSREEIQKEKKDEVNQIKKKGKQKVYLIRRKEIKENFFFSL